MISGANRKKLIEGLAGVASGAGKADYSADDDEPEIEVEIENDDTGGTDFARDALAVIQEYQGSMYGGPGDEKDPAVAKLRTSRRDSLAQAFREAVWGIMRSYKE